jgi:hypothetical protein
MGISINQFRPLTRGLTVAILLALPARSLAAVPAANQTAVTNGLAYLTSQQQADGQISGFSGINPWALMAYTASGQANTNLRAYLLAHPPTAGATATDWEKGILALVADGQNPYNAGGTNYVTGLKSLHTAGQLGSASAVNDDAFGVLALYAAKVPATDPAFADALDFLLDHQLASGGFSYSATATSPDVDDTAAALMAIQAAQTAGSTDSRLAAAKTSARAYILGTQNADGGFPYDPLTPPEWGGNASNLSTTAWVISALSSIGEGSSTAGTNAQNYLKAGQTANGSFPYQSGAGDTFDTSYVVLALSGAGWPVAVYDGQVPTTEPAAVTATPTPVPSVSSAPSPAAAPQASTTPSPSASPTPTPQTGSVLGASSGGAGLGNLPGVGMLGSATGLVIASLLAIGTYLGVSLWRRRQARI